MNTMDTQTQDAYTRSQMLSSSSSVSGRTFEVSKRIAQEITYFDPKVIFEETTHPFMIFSASRRSGKTFTLRDMLSKCKHKWDDVLLISNTAEFNQDYDYIPETSKHTTKDMDSLISDIRDTQKEEKKKGKQMKDYLIIFDDILDDPKIAKRSAGGNVIMDLATLGRHVHISCIVLTQKFNALPTVVRANCDFAFFARCKSEVDINAFCESYLTGEQEGMTENVGTQKRLAKQIYFNIVQEDFHWLVVHNTKQNSSGYNTFCYKYVADKKPKKKFPLTHVGNRRSNGRFMSRDSGSVDFSNKISMGYRMDKVKKKELRKIMNINYH